MSPAYSADMFVGRERDRMWHPAPEPGEPYTAIEVLPARRSAEVCKEGGYDETYLNDLKHFQEEAVKNIEITSGMLGGGKLRPSMKTLLRSKEFCGDSHYKVLPNKDGTSTNLRQAIALWNPENPYAKWWTGIGAAYRFDRGAGGTIVLPLAVSLPFIGGWTAGKVNLPLDRTPLAFGKGGLPPSVDLIFMSSATRKLGWYGGGGWEWKRDREDFDQKTPGLAWEVGFKARTTELKGFLVSGRIGYRFNGTSRIRDQRFVAEIGIGGW